MHKCRLCNQELFYEPIAELRGIPKAAQYFPEPEEFAGDMGIDLQIYQCSGCGLVQHDAQTVSYYREVITSTGFSDGTKNFRRNIMKKLVDQYNLSGKKMLEIGCGKGDMLDIINESGLQAYGLEAGLNSVKYGRDKGRKMIHGYIGEMSNIDNTQFDSFVCFNYLEHLPDVPKVLRNIYNNTTAEAVGLFTVPNLEHLLKSQCLYEFVADHLSYFTTQTLSFALEQSGFEIKECYTINNNNDVLAVVQKKKAYILDEARKDVQKVVQILRNLIQDYSGADKRIAVWGAGHRTLALLSLAQAKEITYVVDSAKFKQGKYTPVLHTPIVSPDTLYTQPVDCIIIMVPGIYPDEVLKTVQGMGLHTDVAILRDNYIEFIEPGGNI